MHIGVKLGPGNERALKTHAENVERMGFHSIWLSERVAVPVDKPHPYPPMADPWIGLAFVAAVTERVTLGTSVSQIALRPPMLMARELATIDGLSGGRLIVGAGAGWVEEEFTSTAIPFADRGGRLNEFVQVLRHLWTRPEEAWSGKYYQIPGTRPIMPLTPGGPPIFIGASSPTGIRRAARFGDGFIAVNLAPQVLAGLRQRLDEMTETFGRPRLPMYAQAAPPATTDDATEMVSAYRGAGIEGIILAQPFSESGNIPSPDVAAALIEAARSA